jgi:hypothetical protein
MADGSGDSAQPRWGSPGEFGEPAAADARTGVATPLLAGFSIALLAVVSQSPASVRWPGPTIFVLILAVGLLVISLQVGFRSRSKLYSRDEALAWGRINDVPADVDEVARAAVQQEHLKQWHRAQRTVRRCYNTGIAALGVALSLTAAPPLTARPGAEQSWRWAAFALGLALTAAEVSWTVRDELIYRRLARVKARQAWREPAP